MPITTAQSEAMARAKEILREHFEGSVIIVRAESERDGHPTEIVEVTYHGGWSAAVGTIEIARCRIQATEESDE